MKITEQMQQSEQFTNTEKAVIQFLIKNSQHIEKLTIHEVAEQTFSSNATIIRLCHKLGYDGYREFKVALVREIESDKYVVKNVDYSKPFEKQESTASIVKSIYSLHKESMDIMQAQLDIRTLEQMVRHLLSAERIFLFGISDVKIRLSGFMNKLLKIGCFPVLATENTEEGNICPYITKKDCAFFVTYSGSHPTYLYCVKILKKNHVPILMLTANPDSSIYPYGTCRLCVPDQEKKDKIAPFYSQLVFEYLLNLIYSLMYRELTDKK